MHIAVITLNKGRGSGLVARQQVRALRDHGAEVTFLHARMDGGVPGVANVDVPLWNDAVPVHEYLPGQPDQRRVCDMVADEASRYAADYEQALDGIGPVDLILAHHGNLAAIAARRVATRRGVPFALFLHGTGIEPRFHGGYDDTVWAEIVDAIGAASGILVTTEYVRHRLVLPLVDVPGDRFEVIPCGVDLEEFTPGAGAELRAAHGLPARYVVCPGAVIHAKGPQNVVAASKWYADIAPTIFLGDGDLRTELEAELGDAGRFLGFVPNEDKAAIINGAALLTAAPEKLEHFGIVYVEALAAGVPPVAYRGGGVETIVTPDTGVLTKRTPQELGQAIQSLLEDEPRRREMGAAARRRAEAHFDEVALGWRLVNWVEALAARAPQPR